MSKLPPAKGFSKQKKPEEPNMRKCLVCGLVMADDMPRGLVIEHHQILGVQCISCAEADTESIKIGTPKNPFRS